MESYAAHVHSWYLRARTRARTIPRGVPTRRGACTIYSKRTFQCTRDSRNFCWCSSSLSFTLKCHILPPATDFRRLGANPFKPVVATSATLFLAASGTGGVVCSGGSGPAAATTCDCLTSPMAPYSMWPITCGQEVIRTFGASALLLPPRVGAGAAGESSFSCDSCSAAFAHSAPSPEPTSVSW